MGKDGGELVFGAIEADLDVRYGARDGPGATIHASSPNASDFFNSLLGRVLN